jgi:hypothetical protein
LVATWVKYDYDYAVWSPDSTMLAITGRFDERIGIALFLLGSDKPKWFFEEEGATSLIMQVIFCKMDQVIPRFC